MEPIGECDRLLVRARNGMICSRHCALFPRITWWVGRISVRIKSTFCLLLTDAVGKEQVVHFYVPSLVNLICAVDTDLSSGCRERRRKGSWEHLLALSLMWDR